MLSEGSQETAIVRVAVGDSGEQPGHASVKHRQVFPAGLLTQSAGEPAFPA
jgi:hypothetical protein